MWRRILTGFLAAACIMLTVELARDRRRVEPHPTSDVIRAAGLPDPGPANKALAFRFGELNIPSATFEQVITDLAARAQANIDVEWEAMRSAGISRTTKMRLHLWDVTLAQALTALLDDAQANSTRPGYYVEGGIIVVSAGTDVRPQCVTVIYNVRDILQLQEGVDGATHAEAAEALVRRITETIMPDSWRDAGGSVGAIGELSGLLIITHTLEGHEEILRLFEQFRTADRSGPIKPAKRKPAEQPGGRHSSGLFG
jgi:hypothetical protein